MKYYLQLVAILLWGGSVYAQIEKGQGLLAGEIGIRIGHITLTNSLPLGGVSTGTSTGSTFTPSLAINRGKFFKDGWLFGYSADFNTVRNKIINDGDLADYTIRNNSIIFRASTYVRRYWKAAMFNVYVGGGLMTSYNYYETKNSNPQLGSSIDSYRRLLISPIFQAGALYPFSRRLALDFQVESLTSPVPVSMFSIGVMRLTGKAIAAGTDLDNFETNTTQAGNWIVSGGVSYSSQYDKTVMQSTQDTTNAVSSFSFSPSIGLFVRKNLLVGVGLNYSLDREKNASPTATLSIAPYVRKYLGNRQLRPYIQGNVDFSPIHWAKRSPEYTTKQLSLQASLGLAYLLGERFIIDANLITVNALYSSIEQQSGETTKSWFLQGLGTMSPGIGLNYVLGRKHSGEQTDLQTN